MNRGAAYGGRCECRSHGEGCPALSLLKHEPEMVVAEELGSDATELAAAIVAVASFLQLPVHTASY